MFHPQGPRFWELVRQALSSTSRGYDLLAPKFDLTPFRTPEPILQETLRILTPLGPFESMIDLCCGTGAGIENLHPLVTTRLVGVDFSEGMLKVARRRVGDGMMEPADGEPVPECVSNRSTKHCEWRLDDVLQMPCQEEFDLAVLFGAQGHILPRDEITLCKQAFQTLRPGGRFVFVTSTRPPWYRPVALAARSFNAVMCLRNWLVKPEFIMYYLTGLWPDVGNPLRGVGFEVQAEPMFPGTRWGQRMRLVIARKPARES